MRKDELAIIRMAVVLRWETGDVARWYSPKGKICDSRIKKCIGGFLVALGQAILFGKGGWKTHINRIEGEEG